jgi:chromosome segregation ATPase
MIANEKDELLRRYNDVVQDRDSLANSMSLELQATKEENESLQSSLRDTEKTLAQIASEKKALEEEQNALKNSLKEATKALEIVSTDMAELEQQKRELENNLYSKLLESKGKHSAAISDVQTRLSETEEALARVKSERDSLQCTVKQLEDHNQTLSLDLNDSQSFNQSMSKELEDSKSCFASETAQWEKEKRGMNEEKVKLTKRWEEEMRNENKEKMELVKRISDMENALVVVCNQQANLDAQTISIERELSRALLETKGKHSKKVAAIQVRLEDTVSSDFFVEFFRTCKCSSIPRNRSTS